MRVRDPEFGMGRDNPGNALSVRAGTSTRNRCGRARTKPRKQRGRSREPQSDVRRAQLETRGSARAGTRSSARARGDGGPRGRVRPLSTPTARSAAAPAPCSRGPSAPRPPAAPDLPCPRHGRSRLWLRGHVPGGRARQEAPARGRAGSPGVRSSG